LQYVFQHDFGIEANAEVNRNFELDNAKWYGINQYLVYTIGETLDIGLRVEWFRDQDNARVLAIPLESEVTGGNYFATTVGLNWMPCDYAYLRPELRWDSSDVDPPGGSDGMFKDFSSRNQLTAAVDLIVRF